LTLTKYLRGWWLLMFLLLFPSAAFPAVPNLVGIWQGTAPGAGPGFCITDKITITITRQCGNLFQGKADLVWTTGDFVGSIKNGSIFYLHGSLFGGTSFFMIMGDYQAGSPASITVTNLYNGESDRVYDTFPANYSGKLKFTPVGALDLLLMSN
jgi:hypothetical protein